MTLSGGFRVVQQHGSRVHVAATLVFVSSVEPSDLWSVDHKLASKTSFSPCDHNCSWFVFIDLPSVFQSTDGNWVALQNVTLPRPRMLAKPKSQVFEALENESSIVSAYDEMGSDSEDDYDWNVALNKLRRRPRQLPGDFYYTSSQYGTGWVYGSDQYQAVTSPSSGLYTNTETLFSDSETSSLNSSQEAKGTGKLLWLQSRTQSDVPRMERKHFHGELDVNFNPQATSLEYSDSSETEEVHYDLEKRSRRWRKNKAISEEFCEEKDCPKGDKMNSSQVIVSELSKCTLLRKSWAQLIK